MDRNPVGVGCLIMIGGSLSARRAWIEIASGTLSDTSDVKSLSARRAWIEITYVIRLPRCQVSVALRKESVDRNADPVLNA